MQFYGKTKQGEVILIDTATMPNWIDDYTDLGGNLFEGAEIVNESSLAELQEKYVNEVGPLPARYKNDPTRILSKLP